MKLSRHRWGWVIATLGALLIACQTLVPQPAALGAVTGPRIGLLGGDRAGIDILLNVLLFIPFGIGLRLAGQSLQRAVAIAAVSSGVIELLQASVIAGRDGNVRDVLTNTLGALIGVVLVDAFHPLAFPPVSEARRLGWLCAACWLMVGAGEAALLERAFLPTTWYGQWAPDGVFPSSYTGRVLAVRLNSLDLPTTRLSDSGLVRAILLQDRWTLTVNATSGEPTRDLCSVFSIFDGDQREMLVVGQKGTDLFVRYRTGAAAIGLRSPSIMLPGTFARSPGEPVEISMSFDRGVISLAATSSGRTVATAVSVSPAWGWSFFLPFDAPIGPLSPLWSGLWIAAQLFPAGYWTARGMRGASRMAVLGTLVLGGLLLILGMAALPLVFRLPPAGPPEWISAAAAIVLGGRLGRAVYP